jgi:hypothetical protein
MSQQITLPSGITVELRDASELKVKDRKIIMLASEDGEGTLIRAISLGENIIKLLVLKWSLELPIPSEDMDSLGELDITDYDSLVEQTKYAQKALFPSIGSSKENEEDPKATTADSKD